MEPLPLPRDAGTRTLASIDIVQVIGADVTLAPAGQNRAGPCPFCEGGTLTVQPRQQYFRCDTCRVSGNALDYVTHRDGGTLGDATRTLLRHADPTGAGDNLVIEVVTIEPGEASCN